MSEWNGFGNLDLSDVEAGKGGRLSEGEHTVRSADAQMETLDANRKRLRVTFNSVDGGGDIRHDFFLMHPNDTAVRIGKEKLKSFLINARHPNPDKPGDVATLNGLECKIIVGMGKPYTDQEGNQRQRTEIKTWRPSAQTAGAEAKADDLDDAIPF